MITWIVIILVALAIMLWWLKGPLFHKGMKRENIERFVKGLVVQCDDGSLLIVEHKNTGRFIQIAKYQSSSKFPILHFGFPKADWSSKYFERLKASLQNERIEYRIQETGDIDVEAFLEVDIQLTSDEKIKEIVKIAELALDIMEIDENEPLVMHYEGELKANAAKSSIGG